VRWEPFPSRDPRFASVDKTPGGHAVHIRVGGFMRKYLAAAVVIVAGFAAFAATCTVSNSSFTEINGRDTFAGQLTNDSGVDILAHRFRVAFIDNDNNLVEVTTVDGCLRSLQNGQDDFFSVRSNAAPSTTKYGLARLANLQEDPHFVVGQTADGNVAITGITATRVTDTLTVTGTIKNNDGDTLVDPAACVVVRDEDGNVLIAGKDDDINSLDEDETADFSVTFVVPDDIDLVDHVDVYVDGLDGDDDAAPIAPESVLDTGVTEQTPTVTGTPATSTPAPTETPTATPTTGM
jgi:hypothetical protein